jgi:hypothetical protein
VVVVEGSYLFRSRPNPVPKTLVRWYRRFPFALARFRSAATSAHRSQPALGTPPAREATATRESSRRFGGTQPIEPLAVLAEELDDGHGEEHAVAVWCAEQLRILGVPPILAELFAGVVDWHQIAKLVERGCSAQLALEIVR